MLTIRLRRTGTTKAPHYRFIVSEKTKDTLGDYLEGLGYYNPRSNPATVQLDVERVKYWVSKGAQMSGTVFNLMVDQGVVPGPKRKVGSKGETKKKLDAEKAVVAEAAAKAKADKEAAAAAEAKPETTETPNEAPAESAAAEAPQTETAGAEQKAEAPDEAKAEEKPAEEKAAE